MSLNEADVIKVAHLARLTITPEKIPCYMKELNKILDLSRQMENVNTSDIEPMAHPFNAKQILRNDKVTQTNQRDLFQALAPAVDAGLYLVPKVIE